MQLIEGIRIEIAHSVPVKLGSESWRVIINYISDIPDNDKLIKSYYIWVTGEYLGDKYKLEENIKSAQKFALEFAKKRFEESNNQIPKEKGVSCSNKKGIIYLNH